MQPLRRSPLLLTASLLFFACGGKQSSGDADGGGPDASTASDSSAALDAEASADAPPTMACIPGRSIGCVGPGGCSSNQVCNGAGTAYGPCNCAPTLDGSLPPWDAGLGDDGSLPPDAGTGDAGVVAILAPGSLGNIASPLPSGSGITYDGQELWLLAASGNPQPYTLVRFDPATSVIDRTFTLPSLFATLATNAFGIAWDGSSIWISVSGDTNSLVVVDPTTGLITRSMSSPTQTGPSDLDFDGTDLWLSSGTGDFYPISPASGGVLQTFPVGGWGRDNGIAYYQGRLFVGELFGGIDVFDTTGTLLGTAVHSNGSPFQQTEVGPSVFVGDELVILSSLGIGYYKIL
jgi:hypothetical protein